MVQQPTDRESEVTAHQLVRMPNALEAEAITQGIEQRLPQQALVRTSRHRIVSQISLQFTGILIFVSIV